MSNLAKKYQIEKREYYQQPTQQPIPKQLTKKIGFTRGEKVLGFGFAIIICLLSIGIISNFSSLYTLNKDYQDTNKLIHEQTNINSDLSMQVSKLSDYDRIMQKAKEMGLIFDENNMKAVSNK